MKVVIPGGTGQVGGILSRALRARGHEVVVLSRRADPAAGVVAWDARTPGPWAKEIDGADVVVNLAGAVDFLLERGDVEGPVNLAAPHPRPPARGRLPLRLPGAACRRAGAGRALALRASGA